MSNRSIRKPYKLHEMAFKPIPNFKRTCDVSKYSGKIPRRRSTLKGSTKKHKTGPPKEKLKRKSLLDKIILFLSCYRQ